MAVGYFLRSGSTRGYKEVLVAWEDKLVLRDDYCFARGQPCHYTYIIAFLWGTGLPLEALLFLYFRMTSGLHQESYWRLGRGVS